MKKPLDRVTEAYYNKMGLKFGDKVRNRIHWICEQAKGETILDVGCSQGITSILLGRESKQVFGIDVLQESIDYANEMLNNEAQITQKYVEFKTANFIDYDFENKKFDVIIFGEILEHITDPDRFIKKATELLTDHGRIIVTVPFGINDYFDHKRTFYMQGLLNLQSDSLGIQGLEILGKWIGLVLVKGEESTNSVDLDAKLLKKLEIGFYNVERDLVNQVTTLKNQNEKLNKTTDEVQVKLQNKMDELVNLKTSIEEIKSTNAHLEEINNDLKQSLTDIEIEDKVKSTTIEEQEIRIKDLSYKLEEAENQSENLQNEKSEMDQKINDLTNEINQHTQDTYDQILTKDRRIAFLEKKLAEFRKKEKQSKKQKVQKLDQRQLIKLQQEVLNEKKKKVKSDELLLEAYNKEERLLKTHSQLLKRYEALRKSKLGSLTINYWKWRRKRFGGKASGSKGN